MLTKLTLTIDASVIAKAKLFARRKNRSVSRIVEDYLSGIADAATKLSSDYASPAPITDKIAGMFSQEYAGQDDKELLEAAILERQL
jgi:hypothetical protein